MSGTLVRRASRAASAITAGALLLMVGAVSALLTVGARDALDELLLAAAHEHGGDVHWEPDRLASPVRVRLWAEGDAALDAETAAELVRRERPVWMNLAGERLLALPVEPPRSERHGDSEDHPHALVLASAPQVTLLGAAGPFLGVSALIVPALAAGAALAQARVMRHALGDLGRATAEIEAVTGLGAGIRLTEAGPAEVHSLLRSTNRLLDRLARATQAQARFTAEAAHELRTPVAALMGELDVLLRRSREPEAYREGLISAREEVGRLAALVDGLLTLARVDAGQAEQGRERERASAIAWRAADQERRALTEAGSPLTVEIKDDPELSVHLALLTAAVANLLRNAARYAPGAEVKLTVEQRGDRLAFVVDDGGPGVPEPEREALFDRLARSGAARRDVAGGLGLGLPLAREIARRHGGDCVLEGSARGGLRAVLTVR